MAAKPDKSFFENCAFVCVDIQPMGKYEPIKAISEAWKAMGITVGDADAAARYAHEVAFPNAVRVTNACRDLKLPMIFIHWGFLLKDGMDLAPAIRKSMLEAHGTDYEKWAHHISDPNSRPADELGVREGEYVLPKSDQDSFTSCNIQFVLQNLGIKNIVFVGGHTGACLGKTAKSAKRHGYKMLCVEDATNDAAQSRRMPNIIDTGYDYVITTEEFLNLVKSAKQ